MPQKTQASSVLLSGLVPLGLVVSFPEVDVSFDLVAVVLLQHSSIAIRSSALMNRTFMWLPVTLWDNKNEMNEKI